MNSHDFPPYSVLMSIYAKERPEWFKISIESMLKQTVPPTQIVIIKDGLLSEALDALLNSYKAKHENLLKIVELPENVGLGLALKRGVEECDYEFIARMDTDDYSVSDRIEKQFTAMIDKSADLVGCIVDEFIDDISNIVSRRLLPETHQQIIKFSKKRTPIAHPSILFKKRQVIESGNYANCYLIEDYDIIVKLLRYGVSAYNIQEPLVLMRVNDEFYYRRGGLKYLIEMLRFNLKLYNSGWFNILDLTVRSAMNCFVCLLPNYVRNMIYKRLLRKRIK